MQHRVQVAYRESQGRIEGLAGRGEHELLMALVCHGESCTQLVDNGAANT
jgi:hypothetical protein